MSNGVAILGAEVSVSVWAERAVPEPAGGVVLTAQSFGMGGWELRLVWVKGDPSEDQYGLSGRCNSFAHVGYDPWGSMIPRPPPWV